MLRVTAIGRSDVGRTRHGKANEDAYHVGDSAFAVADGMGGHLAGEVASTMALEPLSSLDGRVYSDSTEAITALRDAVVEANARVVSKGHDGPDFRGMGTTLTAVMVEGRRAHIAHVGDSRAYLLRNDDFSQLTTDHTLVQRLMDEGRLTAEEAANHPQRSVITRAIGVEDQIDVDAMSLDLQPGDRVLLCSDGLSGPVTDEAIARILAQDDLDRIPDDLIDAANDAGGPDNITAVVLAFEGLATAPSSQSEPQTPATVVVRTQPDDDEEDDDWAGRLGHIGNLNPDHAATTRGRRRSPVVWATALVLVAAVLGGGFLLGRTLLQRSWFVGVAEDGQVTIFQGVPVEIGPMELFWTHRTTRWDIDDVPSVIRDDVREGITAPDADDAELIVANFDELRSQNAERTEDPSDGTQPASPSPAVTSSVAPADGGN